MRAETFWFLSGKNSHLVKESPPAPLGIIDRSPCFATVLLYVFSPRAKERMGRPVKGEPVLSSRCKFLSCDGAVPPKKGFSPSLWEGHGVGSKTAYFLSSALQGNSDFVYFINLCLFVIRKKIILYKIST